MGTQLDIIGSIILGGMLMISMAQFNAQKQSAMLTVGNQTTLQTQMESVTSVFMSDIRKAGLQVKTGNAFLRCERNRLTFRGDLDNNGTADTVAYTFAGAVAYTPNESDTLLIRSWNNRAAAGTDAGLTSLRFQYFDKNNVETSNAASVKTVRVTLTLQSRYPVWNGAENEFQQLSSSFRITARNINT